LGQHGYRVISEGVRTCCAFGLLPRVVAAQAAPARDSAAASRLSERLHARFTKLAAVEWTHFDKSLHFTKGTGGFERGWRRDRACRRSRYWVERHRPKRLTARRRVRRVLRACQAAARPSRAAGCHYVCG
jgi:hypothetical protein